MRGGKREWGGESLLLSRCLDSRSQLGRVSCHTRKLISKPLDEGVFY